MSRLKIAGFVSALMALTFSNSVFAQPCLSGFRHRVPVQVDNSLNGAAKNYEVRLELNTSQLVSAGKMRSLGQDIRFLDKRGNTYAYWIEDGTMNTAKTGVWVKIDSLPAYGIDTFYMYYGNSTATAQSNERATFHLVDQFNGSTLGSQWTSCGSGSVALSRGKLLLTSNYNTASITSTGTVDGPVLVEVTGMTSSGGEAILSQVNTTGNGYAMYHDGSTMQMHTFSQTSTCFSTSAFGPTYSSSLGADWSFAWNGTNQIFSWGSNSNTSTHSTYYPSAQIQIALANIGAYGTLEVDYLRVRGYLPNEPKLTLSKEQSTNFTLTATYNNPLCEGGDLELMVNEVVGAKYSWSGPNGFASNLQNPQLTGVRTSDAGRYDLTVELPTGCATKTASVNVSVSPKAVGGTVSGSQTVCEGSNTGTLALNGYTGSILRWDSSTTANGPWYSISNTSLTQSYTDLRETMYYRAMVSNSGCSIDSSSIAKIDVTPATKGGQVVSTDTVCAGNNSGVLNLSNHVGNVLKWELSTNGNFWQTISNKGTTNSFANLTQSTYYRAAIQNGNCNIEYSSIGQVQVDQQSVGGTVLGSTVVCPTTNSGWVSVYGNRGEILKWESTPHGNTVWSDIATKNDSVQYSGLDKSMDYRVVVKNGACPAAVSTIGEITVLDKSAAGKISGAKVVCASANAGTLQLSNYTGTIEKWQESSGSGWTDLANTTDKYAWTNLSDTTDFRVIVSNQGCTPDTTAVSTVWVNEASNGGYLTGTDKVCANGNTVEINSNKIVGDVVDWESSSDGKAPWSSMGVTNGTLTAQNITATTYYRIKVKNGVCHADYSDSRKVQVDASSNAGSIANNIQLCAGSNLAIMRLVGAVGTIQWQSTTDSSLGSWTTETVTGDRIEFQNLYASKYVRAMVTNGTCAADTSAIGTVEVFQKTNTGVASSDEFHCDVQNSGVIYVDGHNGNILDWKASTNEGRSWTAVAVYMDTLPYSNLYETTWFKATVQNGVCDAKESDVITIHVANASDAGQLVSTVNQLCATGGTGELSLQNATGQVMTWLSMEEGATQYTSLGTQSNTLKFSNLLKSTKYKAVVQNEYCPADTSAPIQITVFEATNPGQIVGATEVCESMGTTILTLSGNNGQVLNWRSATDVNGPWIDLGNTTVQHTISNSGRTEFYSVMVQNGVCQAVSTAPFVFTRYPNTKGGIILGGGELCRGQNEGILELSNFVGDVKYWEVQDTTGVWMPLSISQTEYHFKNVAMEETYRAVVQSGTCPAVTSAAASFSMNELPVADFNVLNPCARQTADIQSQVNSVDPIASYLWSVSDGFKSSNASFSRIFDNVGSVDLSLHVETTKGCTDTKQTSIFINETPRAQFNLVDGVSSNTVCLNTDVTFNNLTVFSDPASLDYQWSFGDGMSSTNESPVHKYTSDGDVIVELKAISRKKCSEVFQLPIVVLPENKPMVTETVNVSLGIPVQLNATGSVKYLWSPAEYLDDAALSNPTATVTENTVFTVTGTDYYGCISTAEVSVMVEEDYTVLPNNIITNNGGADNTHWTVKNIENYPDNKVFVFDRWGREVFSATGYNNEWDGTNPKGNMLPDGVYYYLIEFPKVGKVNKGAINIIRGK